MVKRAINHHIVPKVLQKQFVVQGDSKRIWRTKKDETEIYPSPELKRIEKVFVIRDYNTVIVNGKRSDLIEREFYSNIDDFLGRLLPDVLKTLNRGEVPNFSTETLSSIRDMTMQMIKRTPDFLNDNDDIARAKEVVEATLQAVPDGNASEARKRLEINLTNDVWLREQGRDMRVRATLKDSQRVKDAISDYVPRWAISQTKHSYILSSRMVYRIGNGGSNGLLNPNMEMWMPISPKIALVLLRDPQKRVPDVVVDTSKHIRKVNEYAVRNSFEIASHSETLLKSLIGL